ncbi:hypothetical protein [Nostoc sp. NIES-3756]|uniref:hypothetical protein n=1 Tax=Nostoc sp. NIES-3756 TaxID=1751286 RepID=UPI000835405C|nr:hypothetical protein [Nostoc sp. NIES-3756]
MAIPTIQYNCREGRLFKLAMQSPISVLMPMKTNKYPIIMGFCSNGGELTIGLYRRIGVRQNTATKISNAAWINQGASIKLATKLRIAMIAAKISTISSFATFAT